MRKSGGQGEERLSAREVLVLTLSAGIVTILVENGYYLVHRLVLERLSGATTGFLWIVPLYYGLAFAGLAGILLLVTRFLRRSAAARLVVSTAWALAVFTILLLTLYGKVHQWALLILALGAGVQLGRLAQTRVDGTLRRARNVLVFGGALALVPALVNSPLQRWRETRRAAALPPTAGEAPNVLLIILDTVRAASLSLYGYERPTTPGLQQLAMRGVVFDHAYATTSWTLPSHATIFTGLYPGQLTANWLTPLGNGPPTLAEAFHAAGYRTGGFVANLFYTQEESGLSRGFSHYEDFEHRPGQLRRATALGQFLDTWDVKVKPFHRTSARKKAPVITRQFLNWIDHNAKDRPFFAFLNYFDAHRPYLSSPTLERQFASPNRSLGRYDASIAGLDREMAGLVDSLDRRGLLANTLVIITSDHGEQLGEHDLWEHGNSLYLPSLHVPLIMLFGARLPPGRRPEPVSLRDLPATIAHLAGLRVRFPGSSLTRLWQSPAGEGSAILSQIRKGIRSAPTEPVSRGDMQSLIRDSLHLIVNGDGRPELYVHTRDPGEERDVSGMPGAASQLMSMQDHLRNAAADPASRTGNP